MSSPKAQLHHLYRNSKIPLQYVSESVLIPQESTAHLPVNLLIQAASPQQKGFRCTLYLPNCPPVVSDIFPRKREAEQDAAKKALVQMGNVFSSQDSASKILTLEERFTALVQRVGIVFYDKSVLNYHPLKEHFRAAIACKGERHGFVPATALAALDTKIMSLCRSLHELIDLSPACSLALVCTAALSCSSVMCDKGGLWMRRVVPFASDFEIELLSDEGDENSNAKGKNDTDFQVVENPDAERINNTNCLVVENSGADGKNKSQFQVVYVPHCQEKEVFTCQLKVRPNEYYMDVLAELLHVQDGAHVLMSRTIPRAPHATRLYLPAPDILPVVFVPQGDYIPACTDRNKIHSDQMICDQDHKGKTGSLWNKRASDLVGFPVAGDAILASIGSSWKSGGKLAGEDLSLSCYYRLIIGKNPEGNYKLSRESILVANLPHSYSGRSQWRGGLPRSLLIDFCHQHRLPEPVFSLSCSDTGNNTKSDNEQINSISQKSYKCVVQVTYNYNTLECESDHSYRSRADAVQSAALKALIFILKSRDEFEENHVLSDVSSSLIVPSSIAETFEKKGMQVESLALKKESAQISLLGSEIQRNKDTFSQTLEVTGGRKEQSKALAPGSLVCISYHVCLVGGGISVNLEGQDEFVFELGTGGVIGELEGLVSTMCVGDSKQFLTPLPCMELLLAAQGDAIYKFDKHTLSKCCLSYNMKALRCLEPPEERMESALFSPPLSKQRNEFAIRQIQEAHAKSLIDLGCGSGSLLDALFDYPTNLEHIAGVDISQKSLVRAAKSLHAKLGPSADQGYRLNARSLKSVVLYEGSLAEADLRLCGFDVATCIEVVEHMDPEPLSKVGEIILGIWSPRMLILSTPNIEFNPVLQRMTVEAKPTTGQCKIESLVGVMGKPELLGDTHGNARVTKTNMKVAGTVSDASASLEEFQVQNMFDDENGPQTSKFRNDDHRFEWTRAEFREWAEKLALEFGYSIEYSGVGGSEDGPGFASQIAIFTRSPEKKSPEAKLGAQEPERYCNGSKASCNLTEFGRKEGEVKNTLYAQYTEVWKYDRQGPVTGPL